MEVRNLKRKEKTNRGEEYKPEIDEVVGQTDSFAATLIEKSLRHQE